MTIHNFDQGSPEWYSIRLGKFGSTDAQAVASNGKGLETLCYEKVAEIVTQKPRESYSNADMERGKLLESMARSAYEIQSGNLVEQVGYIEQSEYVGTSPDGLVGVDGMIEIKCPSDANFVKYLFEGRI